MSNEQDDERDFEDYESGPFCRHFGDPSDCEIQCANANCGHRCTRHGAEDDEWGCVDCDCERWVEPEEKL